MAMRRSASEPISQIAIASMSAANATGSAWKLPPESASSLSAKMSGLSETPFASVSSVVAACRIRSSTAPITCGWQRRQYGSCTRSSFVRCEARIALPAINARNAAATSIWPRWPRSDLDPRIEWRVGAARGVGRERTGDQRRTEHVLGREQSRERFRRRVLRAVEECEPFLRPERMRREPCARQRRRPPACARRRDRHRRRPASPRQAAPAARDRRRRRPSPGSGSPGSIRAPASLRASRPSAAPRPRGRGRGLQA